jgi:hypothetical protein
MNRDSLKKMRFDRRLLNRRGWMSRAEQARTLEELPDVGGKATTLGAASDDRGETHQSAADEPSHGL